MSDINIRSDSVDVDQIMRQIRARIREKRGVDYTEEEIRELAAVKLEKFLDPRGVRSDLLEQFRRSRAAQPPAPSYTFEDSTLYDSHRLPLLGWLRRILNPILKLFFNPNPLIHALHIQSELNARQAQREELDALHYEMLHNLVLELTRLGIEVKNLKMRVESMSSRLDFDERRARALEGVVAYRPGATPPLQPPTGGEQRPPIAAPSDPGDRRTRRRRRRGRRRPGDRGEGRPESQNAGQAAVNGVSAPQHPSSDAEPAPTSVASATPEYEPEPGDENQGDGGASDES